MARLTKKEKNSIERKEKTLDVLTIILWPFKIIYIALSWVIKGMVLAIGWIIGLFSRDNYAKAKPILSENSGKAYYEPFKIIETVKGKYSTFESFLVNNPSTIGIILGARGTGKSAIGLKLFENLRASTRKNMYAMGFRDLPDWIKVVDSLEDIENDSYVLIDEGGILFSARKSFSDANKLLSELLLIARHKDLSVIFISQNSSNLEINAIRQTDYLIMKPSSLLQMDFERKKIKEVYQEADDSFKKHKKVKGLTYIYSDQFKGFVANPLPTFWTSKISKSFRNNK